MWRQHLFSARTATETGSADGFHILTAEQPSDYQFTEQILTRKGRVGARHAAFIVDCGDKFYIGVDGKVPDVLGKDSPHAYEKTVTRNGLEKGREITFVHGYFAPKGTPIPDMAELLERQPKDLKEILERANNGESKVVIKDATFTKTRVKGTDWDKIATEFEKGKSPHQGMTFTTDGKKFEPIEGKVNGSAFINSAAKKGSFVEKIGKMSTGSKWAAGAGIAAVAAGSWYAYTHSKSNESRNSEHGK